MGVADELIREMPKGLLAWYDFKKSGKVLQIVAQKDAITELLVAKQLEVVCALADTCVQPEFCEQNDKAFDYIVAVGTLEQCADLNTLFLSCKKLLKEDGVLLAGVDNRMGIRYFCGDRDPYTGRNFDGIENYRRARTLDGTVKGRCYNRSELADYFCKSGFTCQRFYSVFPEIEHPQLIYAEDYLPKEELATRIFPMYHYPDSVFLEEEFLYTDLVKNGMFHAMANGYLVECSLSGELANVKHVTLSTERGREDALLTIVRRDEKVEKRALNPEGEARIREIAANALDLSSHGIPMAEGKLEGSSYVMSYVDGDIATVRLRTLLNTDKEAFIAEMDLFRNLILQSSEVVEESEQDGVILKRGYFDLVPINCFYIDGQYVFFDQEFVQENYPANVMILRLIEFAYYGNANAEKLLPRDFFYERYGLKPQLEKWFHMSGEFLTELKKEKELREFHERHRRNTEIVNSNRQRINYTEAEYRRLFVDIFRNTENRKLILFGSGNFAKKFIALYGQDYPVYAIVDNKAEKWGQDLEGIPIKSPEILRELETSEYKVIVCIKNYLSVVEQLKELGVKEYSIYDTNVDYPRKNHAERNVAVNTQDVPKKYHTGYVAGVFDLFHVGHLNMFKRAKEQCEYLIVGVVTDEGVRKHKKVEPFIPFAERIEMVRSCKYVDEAVEIPVNYGGTRDAYRLYHFDVQFSGSDYVNNPDWLAEKMFLEKQGVDMVFFPYTEGTSSTQIKAMIEKSLL